MARRTQSLNPSQASSLMQLTSLLSDLDQHEEALKCSQQALKYEEREHGKNTQQYAAIRGLVGLAHLNLGHVDVALSWFQRVRAGYEKLNAVNTTDFGGLLITPGLQIYELTTSQKRCYTLLAPRQSSVEYCRQATH